MFIVSSDRQEPFGSDKYSDLKRRVCPLRFLTNLAHNNGYSVLNILHMPFIRYWFFCDGRKGSATSKGYVLTDRQEIHLGFLIIRLDW